MLCVDVVAECDRYVGERWERGVCKGKEGGPGGVRGVEGGGVVSPPPSTHAWVESTAWMTRWGWPSRPTPWCPPAPGPMGPRGWHTASAVGGRPARLGQCGRVVGTPDVHAAVRMQSVTRRAEVLRVLPAWCSPLPPSGAEGPSALDVPCVLLPCPGSGPPAGSRRRKPAGSCSTLRQQTTVRAGVPSRTWTAPQLQTAGAAQPSPWPLGPCSGRGGHQRR